MRQHSYSFQSKESKFQSCLSDRNPAPGIFKENFEALNSIGYSVYSLGATWNSAGEFRAAHALSFWRQGRAVGRVLAFSHCSVQIQVLPLKYSDLALLMSVGAGLAPCWVILKTLVPVVPSSSPGGNWWSPMQCCLPAAANSPYRSHGNEPVPLPYLLTLSRMGAVPNYNH